MSTGPNGVINLGSISAEDVHVNVAPVVIATTEDKLRLALYERQSIFRARDAWIAPFSLLVSIVLALATTSFRKFGLEANVWEAVFYLAAAGSTLWLLVAVIKRPKPQSIDAFVNSIKKAKES